MKYFQTSDKKLFYVEDLARNHARSLEDKTVKKVDSADLKAESKEKTTANKTATKTASKKETGKEIKDSKTTDSKKENLETEVNQDKSKGPEQSVETGNEIEKPVFETKPVTEPRKAN